ncbi:MAG: asparagine--tRNA ligase [Desulfobulbaceae bacterium]|nr:asparagine--tRNA ligase [Desulfobulbaceae bacterium]HIJ78681.1 asparagine--tRNA ligase [Deltaproteobacteria bacterium]
MAQYQRIAQIIKNKPVGELIEIRGWLRTRRDSKGFSFLEVNDGSCLANIQIVADDTLANYADEILRLSTGCSVKISGLLAQSPAKGQDIEIQARRVEVVGWADPETYPLQKKRHSFEFLREIAHLRPRSNSLGAVTRVRSALSFAVHCFFNERGFCQIHTPIITTSDCEGAGEMFTVTTLDLNNLAQTNGRPDFEKDFFGRQASLTVSGQLEAEIYCQAMGNVYTFGPTFRAENSNTSRHLAEFWMIEPEMAFCDLNQDIEVAQAFIKYLVQYALDNCAEDLALFSKFVDKDLAAKLEMVVNNDFARITYSEAVDRLQHAEKLFAFPVEWGSDLQSEHERYLTEEVFKRPLIVTDYPKTIKPFYMRVNDDNKTVAAMDILVPGIGEIIGGSQREERLEVLINRIQELGLNQPDYEWYLDLRRYGSVPHAGFGLGFERIIQFVTGMANIREVIPFPRTPGSAAL